MRLKGDFEGLRLRGYRVLGCEGPSSSDAGTTHAPLFMITCVTLSSGTLPWRADAAAAAAAAAAAVKDSEAAIASGRDLRESVSQRKQQCCAHPELLTRNVKLPGKDRETSLEAQQAQNQLCVKTQFLIIVPLLFFVLQMS